MQYGLKILSDKSNQKFLLTHHLISQDLEVEIHFTGVVFALVVVSGRILSSSTVGRHAAVCRGTRRRRGISGGGGRLSHGRLVAGRTE